MFKLSTKERNRDETRDVLEPEPGVGIRILELPNIFLAHTGYFPIQPGLLGARAVSPAVKFSECYISLQYNYD